MKSRPILFSAPMVRALLAGTKTQTRRICKPQPIDVVGSRRRRMYRDEDFKKSWQTIPGCLEGDGFVDCPHGQPGDQLWVRERMRRIGAVIDSGGRPSAIDLLYEADKAIRISVPFPARIQGIPKHGQCLAYGGYREASRITLDIASLRVERLQEISEADAISEGLTPAPGNIRGWLCPLVESKSGQIAIRVDDPRVAYRGLWETINGIASWTANPWVWVIEFKQVTP